MGYYIDGELTFEFRADTPDHVLAAFSALAADSPAPPDPELVRRLPAPVEETEDEWEPALREMGSEYDEFFDEPWRHNWADHLQGTMTWDVLAWKVVAGFCWKTGEDIAVEALSWLGPYLGSPQDRDPNLPRTHVGYLQNGAGDCTELWLDRRRLVADEVEPEQPWV